MASHGLGLSGLG